MGVLTGYEPQRVLNFFEKICEIPHGSGNTGQICGFLADFALERGLKYLRDEYDNIIIWKDGSRGYEKSKPVILQGHIDMVCEKEDSIDFDFEREGIRLKVNDGVISADGTTLGGDDGIAVAYCLAILDSDDIAHPPIEAVFTSDEEIGMLGAAAMDMSPLKGRTFINIDSEDEGYLLVSCAGGVTAKAVLPAQRSEQSGIDLRIRIDGLAGGHSGVEIDKGRANSNVLMGRVLFAASEKAEFVLKDVRGGSKDNAIPRSSEAVITAAAGADAEKIKELCAEMSVVFKNEYRVTDPDIGITVSAAECDLEPMDKASSKRVITALVNMPGGIERMSFDIDGLVETSLNMGILYTEENQVCMSFSVRSSVESEKNALVSKITCLAEALGGKVESSGAYPAWEYKKDSPLRELFVRIFEKRYGRKPVVQALHAGVECGLFAGRLKGLDAVSFGPDISDIHTPKESMAIDSVKRTWDYLLEILSELK